MKKLIFVGVTWGCLVLAQTTAVHNPKLVGPMDLTGVTGTVTFPGSVNIGNAVSATNLAVNVKGPPYNATCNGVADDTAALNSAAAAAIVGNTALYVPSGTCTTTTGLLITQPLTIFGSGDSSILQVTNNANGAYGIKTQARLTVRDMRISLKTPVDTDHGTVGVLKLDTDTPSTAVSVLLDNVAVDGFNFAVDVAGSNISDTLPLVTVRDCRLSIRQNPGSVGEPLNVRYADQLVATGNRLDSNSGKGDHGIYLIGVINVFVRDTQILNPFQYGVKVQTALTGTYGTWLFDGVSVIHPSIGFQINPQGTAILSQAVVRNSTVKDAQSTTAGESAVMFSVSNTATLSNAVVDGVHVLNTPENCISFGGATGTITNASVTASSCYNFGTSSSGTYSAIIDSTATFGSISVRGFYADCNSVGRSATTLQNAFVRVSTDDITEANCTTSSRNKHTFNTPSVFWASANFPAGNVSGPVTGDVWQDSTNIFHLQGMTIAEATLPSNVPMGLSVPRICHARYSFGPDGGAVGTLIPANNCTLPANAVVTNVAINSTTAVTSAGAATIAIGTTAGSSSTSLLAATAKTAFSSNAFVQGVPVPSTASTWVKLTAQGQPNVTIGTASITAGIVEIYIYYYVSAS